MNPTPLEKFLADLKADGTNIQSLKAAGIYDASPHVVIPTAFTKVQLHDALTAAGLRPESPMFNRIWGRHSITLPLRAWKS